MITSHGFNSSFPQDQRCRLSFLWLLAMCTTLVKHLFRYLAHCLIWLLDLLLTFKTIFTNNVLCRQVFIRCFENIFKSVAYLLNIITGSLKSHFLILTKSYLLVYDFLDWSNGITAKKSLDNQKPQRFSPVFSSRNFIIHDFSIEVNDSLKKFHMIHFELTFVHGTRYGLKFIFFLHMAIQVFQHHVLKSLI